MPQTHGEAEQWKNPYGALVERIARAIVHNPDQVSVRAVEGDQFTVFVLRVDPTDLGNIIGPEGRVSHSIRTILFDIGMKLHWRFSLEIIEYGTQPHHTDAKERPERSASPGAGRTESRPQPRAVPPKNPHAILGVSPGATLNEITAAYHREALKNHPDKVANMADEIRELAERRMKEINAAFQELKSRVK